YDGTSLTYFDSTNSPFSSSNIYYYMLFNQFDDIFVGSGNNIGVYHNSSWTTYDTTFFNLHYLSQSCYSVSPTTGDFTLANISDTTLKTFDVSDSLWNSIGIPTSLFHGGTFGIQFSGSTYDSNGNFCVIGDSTFFSYDGF